jgi:hypothetical protein
MFYTLLILLLISSVVNIFLLISLKRAFNQIDILEVWLLEFKLLMDNTYKKLKNIDERGMFEKDDDVGIVFKNIIEIIDLTNKRIQINDDDKP